MADIEARELSYTYPGGQASVLDRLDLRIHSGEFVCIIGKSGCGKSTLLHLLAGLLHPDAGQLLQNGVPVTGPDTGRSLVFQQDSLFPWMTALQNVAFGIRQADRGLGRRQARNRALEYLRLVGMESDHHKHPGQLSGGMLQRTAIARALGMDADILLLDEPFGALDAKTRAELQGLLCTLWDSAGARKTVVFVTHDVDESILLCDRILHMADGAVAADIPVPFPRPRHQEALLYTPAYREFRAELLARLGDNGAAPRLRLQKGA